MDKASRKVLDRILKEFKENKDTEFIWYSNFCEEYANENNISESEVRGCLNYLERTGHIQGLN